MAQCLVLDATLQTGPKPSKVTNPTENTWPSNQKRPPNNRLQCLKLFQTFRTVTRKFNFMSFNQSRVPFDRLNRNRASIEIGRDSRIDFLTISIDRVKVSIDWKYWISNFHLENFRTWIFTLLTSWNNTLQTQTSLLQPIYVYTYIYNSFHQGLKPLQPF